MEDEIIRRLYLEYLNEMFEKDKISKSRLSYTIKTEENQHFFVINGKKEQFKEIKREIDGYSLVEGATGYNFIDSEGNFLLDEWVDDAWDFSNGYAYICKNGKSNFIDTEGNLVSKKWLSNEKFSSMFYPNRTAVLNFRNRKTAIMDRFGNINFYGKFVYIGPFYGNNAIALNYSEARAGSLKDINYKDYHIISADGYDTSLGYKYSDIHQIDENIFIASSKNPIRTIFIDERGQRIGDVEFTSCPYYGFRDGYFIVCKDGMSNIVSKDCKLLYKNWYESVEIPYEGFSVIRRNGKYNYIDKDEKLLSDTWFEYAKAFHEGTAVVKIDGKMHIIDSTGKISEESFDEIFYSKNGYREVERDGKYNVISKEGKPLLAEWNDYAHYDIQDRNLMYVERDNKVNYLDFNGKPLLDEWKDFITLVSNGFFASVEGETLVIYDLDGKIVDKVEGISSIDDIHLSFRANFIKDKVKKPNYRRKWFHYEYEDENGVHSLEGIPIADYGEILILDINNTAYTYNKSSRKTDYLGSLDTIKLESNYIIVGDKKYFISGPELIDISSIDFERKIDVKPGIDKIKTFQEFREQCRTEKYQDIINKELEKVRLKQEAERNRQIEVELERKKEEERKLLEEKQQNIRKSLSNLSEILSECSKYLMEIQGKINTNQNEKVLVPEELLLVQVDDHYEFNPIFLTQGILRFIDLRNISLADVKVSGVDLSYTNATINPQEIYNKDMSNGKFCGIDFNLCDFTGVNITGADFTDAIMDFAINNDVNTK